MVPFNAYVEDITPLTLSPHPAHYVFANHQWQQWES